jgi:hypothetical protein
MCDTQPLRIDENYDLLHVSVERGGVFVRMAVRSSWVFSGALHREEPSPEASANIDVIIDVLIGARPVRPGNVGQSLEVYKVEVKQVAQRGSWEARKRAPKRAQVKCSRERRQKRKSMVACGAEVH